MSDTAADANDKIMQIDIASDVVCPWCLIGYKQLERALEETGTRAEIRWHPFELNPQMPEEGEDLQQHLIDKYAKTREENREAHKRIADIGAKLGFKFNYAKNKKIVNTFRAHQLLCWADTYGKRQELAMALFEAFFTNGKNLNKNSVLASTAASVGLDRAEALAVLKDGRYANEVRGRQQMWGKRGIQGVPAMIFNNKYLVTGAQGVDGYTSLLQEFAQEPAV